MACCAKARKLRALQEARRRKAKLMKPRKAKRIIPGGK